MKIIRFQEISEFSTDGKFVLITLSSSKMIRMPLALFNENEREEVINLFTENTGNR